MKKIAIYDLTESRDQKSYEDLMNDPLVTIIEKQILHSPRDGSIKAIIWYLKEDE